VRAPVPACKSEESSIRNSDAAAAISAESSGYSSYVPRSVVAACKAGLRPPARQAPLGEAGHDVQAIQLLHAQREKSGHPGTVPEKRTSLLWRNRTFALGAAAVCRAACGGLSTNSTSPSRGAHRRASRPPRFPRPDGRASSRSGTTTYRTTWSSGARAETDAYGFPSADEVLFASNTQPPPLSCMTRRPRDRATASNLSESRAGCVTKRMREP
jgi:hypothetical protein